MSVYEIMLTTIFQINYNTIIHYQETIRCRLWYNNDAGKLEDGG